MTPIMVSGTLLWAVASLVLLAMLTITGKGDQRWLEISLAGLLIGLVGTAFMLRHDAKRGRRPPAG